MQASSFASTDPDNWDTLLHWMRVHAQRGVLLLLDNAEELLAQAPDAEPPATVVVRRLEQAAGV
jgi:hypothetical protein